MTDPMAGELDCGAVAGLAADYAEGLLALADRRRLDRHATRCDPCRRDLEELRTIIRVAGRPVVDAVPPATMAELLRALRGRRR